MRHGAAPLLGAVLVLAACSDEAGNFSQHPGFAAWYAAHPAALALPTTAEQALLERYRPRILLPGDHPGPIDFYRDYIAHGVLRAADGAPISAAVTPEILNAHKHDPGVVFTHRPARQPPRPAIYGRIDRGELRLPDCVAPLPVTFLTWHLVFAHSGLPAALPAWQATALGLLADLADWHQLDHYTALTLALAPDRAGGLVPFAVTFQHHNYLRSYLLAEQAGPGRLALPPDGRIAVDVALRSNELYPHEPGRVRRRAVSFMTPESARYLVEGVDRPWLAADDVTAPEREIEPELRFLPPADAFYVFAGWLGERRLLPGRDGPPGADYNTLPAFKSKAVQLALFYWAEGAADYPAMLAELFADGRPGKIAPQPFVARLARDLPPSPTGAACSSGRGPRT
jgi:hypothetical protein